MRILIAAVGKLKDAEERAISERYAKRFNGAGSAIGLGPIEIRELPESRAGSARRTQARRSGPAFDNRLSRFHHRA